ncbi:MAG TPA: hypothetical protein VIH76_20210 [Candidatus Acidoferrales bacterium]
MRAYIGFCVLVLATSLFGAVAVQAAPPQKRDYLSEEEGDKIRDAETLDQRVKLFLSFATDRLKKFQYEEERTLPQARREETLNGLLNAYSGCVDDASDVISLAIEKQKEIRAGIKEMQTDAKQFLETLHKFEKNKDVDSYKETLDDAIEGTEDALQDAEKGEKEMSPPPVRRPQS